MVVVPSALTLALVAILAAAVLETSGSSSGPPSAGDHWHARYAFVVCDEVQEPAPEWESGVHTHDDGLIHIHPFTSDEEGRGARLVKWFEYGGGTLTDDEVRLPGDETTYQNGDECPGLGEGIVQVFVTSAATGTEEELEDWSEYIPQDGDIVVVYFGPDVNQ
jgi:hypothetical protein